MNRAHVLRAGIALLTLWVLALPAWAAGGGGGGGGGGLGSDDRDEFKPLTYKSGVKAIKAKDYRTAVTLMSKAVEEDPQDADAYNYLGYAHRKLGEYDDAIKNYKRALELDPKHLGAHEYLGEAYLELKQLDEAKQHLAALDKICWLGCEQYSDLKRAVVAYESANR